MADAADNNSSNVKEFRNYGFVMAVALTTIGALLVWRGKDNYPALFAIAAAFLLAALIVPAALRPLYKVWMALAHILGWIMTRVILIVAFVLLVTPVGLLLRLYGKDLLDLRFDAATQGSYWKERDLTSDKQRNYEKQS